MRRAEPVGAAAARDGPKRHLSAPAGQVLGSRRKARRGDDGHPVRHGTKPLNSAALAEASRGGTRLGYALMQNLSQEEPVGALQAEAGAHATARANGRTRAKGNERSVSREAEDLDTRENALQLLRIMAMPVPAADISRDKEAPQRAVRKPAAAGTAMKAEASSARDAAAPSAKPSPRSAFVVGAPNARSKHERELCVTSSDLSYFGAKDALGSPGAASGPRTPEDATEGAIVDVALLCLGLERRVRERTWDAFQDFFDDVLSRECQDRLGAKGYCIATSRASRGRVDAAMDLELQRHHSRSLETRLVLLGLIRERSETSNALENAEKLAQLEQMCIRDEPPCLEPGAHLDVLAELLERRIWLLRESPIVHALPYHQLIRPREPWTPCMAVCTTERLGEEASAHPFFDEYVDGKGSRADRRARVLRIPDSDIVFFVSAVQREEREGQGAEPHPLQSAAPPQILLNYCYHRSPADFIIGRAGRQLHNLGEAKLHARWRIKRNLKASGKSLRVAAFSGWTRAASFFIFNLLQRRRSFGQRGKADGVSELLHGFGIMDGSNKTGRDFLVHAFFLHHCSVLERKMTSAMVGYHGRQLRECVNDVLDLAGAPSPRAVLDKFASQEANAAERDGDLKGEILPVEDRIALLEKYAQLIQEIAANLGFSVEDGSFQRVYETATRRLEAAESSYRAHIGLLGPGRFVRIVVEAAMKHEAQQLAEPSVARRTAFLPQN